jgi:hypothetical protein
VRRVATAVALCLMVTGCSDSGDGAAHDAGGDSGWETVAATDGTGSVDVPAGWTTQRGFLRRPVVIAEHGHDPAGSVRVSTYLDEVGAERAAVESSAILARENVLCDRLDGSEAFGDPHLVFDCPRERSGRPTRRTLLIPLSHPEGSALVLVDVDDAETLEDARDLVQPVIESWTWR